jgi:uncharacterized protein (UPF0261 family)
MRPGATADDGGAPAGSRQDPGPIEEAATMAVLLVGTLDTKGREVQFVRDRLRAAGVDVAVLDASGTDAAAPFRPEIPREAVFAAAGTDVAEVAARGDRGHAVATAAAGATTIAGEMAARGELDGVLAVGGSAGTTIGTAAMRAAPFGVPKVMVSTLASGQVRPYVGGSDIFMLHSVADIAGLNRITRDVLANAADALIGMLRGRADRPRPSPESGRPLVTATMFGVTTPCVDRARAALEGEGFEVVVFHATGVGGQAMEGLVRDGQVAGVLDLTTTELADELVGGILSAGPERLLAAGRRGVPQVVSVGALDMVNFGPRETVPERFAGRLFHVHNPTVTLMRTTPAENARLGGWIAERLRAATGPTTLLLPLGGVSALDAPGKPFRDPEADAALFESLRAGLAGAGHVRVIERPEHINDAAFAEAAAAALGEILQPGADRAR